MGIPEQRRAITTMRDRWRRDEARLEQLFGTGGDEFAHETEMLRNIGSAIAHAEFWIEKFRPKPVTEE